jgi:large subunit ribosomal protein L2
MKVCKSIINSTRNLIRIDRSILSKETDTLAKQKGLIFGVKRSGARNSHGRITVRFRGGSSHRKKIRIVDFKRFGGLVNPRTNSSASLLRKVSVVKSIEYDPNRNAFIAFVESNLFEGNEIVSNDAEFSYILAYEGIKVGDKISCSYSKEGVQMRPGDSLPLSQIKVGSKVHNIEIKPGSGGVMARAAGMNAEIQGQNGSMILLKLGSGEVRMVHGDCFATIGIVSNADQKNTKLSKAGRKRWVGKRPHVRGVAMNPIDHPLGGGEGKSSGGRHPVSPWGQPAKGKKTRSRKKISNKFIVSRRKK